MTGTQISILGSGNLSEHLTKAEVRAASHKTITTINSLLPPLFELVRKYSGGTGIAVGSAGRDHDVNGSVSDSSHLSKNAFDLSLSSSQMLLLKTNVDDFLSEAISLGLRGFGVYSWGVHIDVGKKPSKVWFSPSGHPFKLRHWSLDATPLWLSEKVFTPVQHGTTSESNDEKQPYFTKSRVISYLVFGVTLTTIAFWVYKKYFKR